MSVTSTVADKKRNKRLPAHLRGMDMSTGQAVSSAPPAAGPARRPVVPWAGDAPTVNVWDAWKAASATPGMLQDSDDDGDTPPASTAAVPKPPRRSAVKSVGQKDPDPDDVVVVPQKTTAPVAGRQKATAQAAAAATAAAAAAAAAPRPSAAAKLPAIRGVKGPSSANGKRDALAVVHVLDEDDGARSEDTGDESTEVGGDTVRVSASVVTGVGWNLAPFCISNSRPCFV
jgi:hypothetical protein